jgi:REP element-mobilizing transposase RayT
MILNQYGLIAHNEWLNTPKIRPNVKLGEFIIMPNHMHAIIRISRTGELHSPENEMELHSPENEMELHSPENEMELHSPENEMELHSPDDTTELHDRTGELHSPYNISESQNRRDVCNTSLRSASQTIGAITRGYKSSVTKQLNSFNIGVAIWQRNYYEHIIRNEISYQNISNYIINNPQKWAEDKFYKNE